jgi:serine/threonine protein kinase
MALSMSTPMDREVAVFNAARRLPAGERAAYLDGVCGGDPALRQRVEELLRATEEAGGFLQDPAPGAQRPAATLVLPNPLPNAAAPGEKVGDRIGSYKLLQQIGEGGCGVVYMAEQEEPVRRRVALKVIKLGMDTKQVVARFEAERQALALMDHPNIAKVLEAGATDTGRPYFVMELVRGIKITQYCDENNLSTRERLDLFIKVAQAVQHAHQKGIIHRDLKPSNVLVADHDGVPVPKVIDFGIAKATTDQRLTDKTLFTAFEQFIGTPAYMSPEQARMSGLDIDTRTDIYSLGVLLYELLTGKTPFDAEDLLAAGLDEMRRTISEKEPARPSTRLSTMLEAELTTTAKHRRTDAPKLIHLLHGDLDWIVMKALEKDRARRYETANGLAMDIERHLKNEPVVARPPSNLYRFQKLVRRNRLAFAAMGAVAAALVIGMGLSTWQFIEKSRAYRQILRAEQAEARLRVQAEAEKKKAQTEAAKSQQVAQFLKDMLKGVGPSVALGRDTTMLREILDRTAERVGNDLTNQPEVALELCNTLGSLYFKLGQFGKAESMYRRSLEVTKKLSANEQPAMAATLHYFAELLRRERKSAEAEAMERQALAIYRRLFGNEHPTVAASLNNLGLVLNDQGKLGEAALILGEAVAISQKSLGPEHPETGVSLSRLGNVLQLQGKLSEAENIFRDALRIEKKGLGKDYSEFDQDRDTEMNGG